MLPINPRLTNQLQNSISATSRARQDIRRNWRFQIAATNLKTPRNNGKTSIILAEGSRTFLTKLDERPINKASMNTSNTSHTLCSISIRVNGFDSIIYGLFRESRVVIWSPTTPKIDTRYEMCSDEELLIFPYILPELMFDPNLLKRWNINKPPTISRSRDLIHILIFSHFSALRSIRFVYPYFQPCQPKSQRFHF